MTAMKLQKLVYYSQVWSVVWEDDVLFAEPIEAWKNGPVVRVLWVATKGQFRIERIPTEHPRHGLGDRERGNIDRVLAVYGDKDAQWLSDLTHMEAPWKEAYGQGQNTEISLETISEYYSTIGSHESA